MQKHSIAAVMLLLAGCSANKTHNQPPGADAPRLQRDYVQEYFQRNPDLQARDGNKIIKAPAEDSAVARLYPRFKDKGPLRNGQRITIMTARSTYRPGEAVRIIHVLEAPRPGHEIYIMGPKAIEEEFVDGKLVSPKRNGLTAYDGAVVKSPGVDFNYEVSIRTFNTPGVHTIQWRGGGHPIQGNLKLESNILKIVVEK